MGNIDHIVDKIAKWLEVFGFLLSGFTFIKVVFLNKEVKKLNARHLFDVRVDEHLADFKKTSRKIASLLGNYLQNIKELRLEISKSLANCLSLRKKVDKSELETLTALIRHTRKIIANKNDNYSTINCFGKFFGKRPLLEKDIDEYYQTLALLITEIENLYKDNKNKLI